MRNDAHDELDNLPSLTPGRRDDYDEPAQAFAQPRREFSAAPAPVADGPSTGPLWALIGALSIALAGLGWWSLQQNIQMEQRLVATQESFARISEEAAGRIQDISGKVVATESSVTSDSEALKLNVKQLENRLAEVSRQMQQAVARQAESQQKLEQLAAAVKKTAEASAAQDQRLQSLSTEQAALKTAQAETKNITADVAKLDKRLTASAQEIAALKQQGNPAGAIERLEQDVLVLRSELDNRPAPVASGPSTAEFDNYRGQVTRQINTLQSQVQNLQQQLNAR